MDRQISNARRCGTLDCTIDIGLIIIRSWTIPMKISDQMHQALSKHIKFILESQESLLLLCIEILGFRLKISNQVSIATIMKYLY